MRALPITQHLWRMSRYGANAYLVGEQDGSLTLVDTMFKGCGGAIRAAAARIGPVERVVVTHAHFDHAGSVDELGVGEVLTGEVEAPYLSGAQKGRWLYPVKHTPVRAVAHGERIGSLEVVPAPGHTRGQIALLDTRDRTLLCGDAFATIGRVCQAGKVQMPFPIIALVACDRAVARQTAQALTALQPARLASGHGRVLKDPVQAMAAVTG